MQRLLSADELILEETTTPKQKEYLKDFIERWESSTTDEQTKILVKEYHEWGKENNFKP